MDVAAIIKQSADIVKKYVSDAAEIYLFGSWVTGTAQPHSDVDIGVDTHVPLPDQTMMHIQEEIDTLPTLRKIDIVDLRIVGERFRNSVIRHGKKL